MCKDAAALRALCERARSKFPDSRRDRIGFLLGYFGRDAHGRDAHNCQEALLLLFESEAGRTEPPPQDTPALEKPCELCVRDGLAHPDGTFVDVAAWRIAKNCPHCKGLGRSREGDRPPEARTPTFLRWDDINGCIVDNDGNRYFKLSEPTPAPEEPQR